MRLITLVTFCRIFQPIFNLHLGHWSSNVSHSSRSRRVTPQKWYGVFFPNMIEDGSWQHSLNLGQYGICSTEVKGHRDILCVCVCASSIYNMLQRRTKYHSHPNWIWHPIALSLAASDGHIVTSPHCTRSIHLTHCYGQGVEGSVSPPNLKIIGNIVSIKSGRTRNLGGRKIRNETWNTSQHLGRLKGR